MIASVENGRTEVEFRQLAGIRPFIDRHITLENAEDVTGQLIQVLPDPERMKDAIVRLTIDYPRTLEGLVDENALRDYAANAFEFHLIDLQQVAVMRWPSLRKDSHHEDGDWSPAFARPGARSPATLLPAQSAATDNHQIGIVHQDLVEKPITPCPILSSSFCPAK